MQLPVADQPAQRFADQQRVAKRHFPTGFAAHDHEGFRFVNTVDLLGVTLLQGLRRLALSGTALARATCATLRLKLVKIGAVIVRPATRVRLHLSSYHPGRDIFVHAHGTLAPPR